MKVFGHPRGTLPRNWCSIYQLLAFLRRCLINFYSKATEQVSLLTDATNLPNPTFLARSSALDRLHLCEGFTLGISGFVVMTQGRGIESLRPKTWTPVRQMLWREK